MKISGSMGFEKSWTQIIGAYQGNVYLGAPLKVLVS